MSILSNVEIQAARQRSDIADRLIITPLLEPDVQLGPASVDLRLGTEIVEMARHSRPASDLRQMDLAANVHRRIVVPLGQVFTLHPGQFLLGSTLEFVRLPPWLSGQIHARSSWGRVGLQVATAPAIQPGYSGMVTMELTNLASVPIQLFPGMRIAQVFLWRAGESSTKPYDSKYAHALGPQESMLKSEQDELAAFAEVGRRIGSVRQGDVGSNRW